MKITTVNPTTEEALSQYEMEDEQAIARKIATAESAFRSWRTWNISDRAQLLANCAKLLREKKAQFATLITSEMGKPIKESAPEVEKCAWLMDFYAQNGKKFLEDEIVSTDFQKSYVTFEPLGIVASIMPWNFPFWQAFRFAIPALTAGNVVLLKHASVVTGCGVAIEKLLLETGFPEGVFQTVVGDRRAAGILIDSPRVSAVSLTGSVATGLNVAERASKHLKKFVLELGGSDLSSSLAMLI